MNQTNTIRQIAETWYKTPQAAQDRFDPATIVVNQGDTIVNSSSSTTTPWPMTLSSARPTTSS